MAAAFFTTVAAPAMAADGLGSSSRAAIDMIYVDSELAPHSGGGGGESRSVRGSHPIYHQLREALADYRRSWVGLPQIDIPDGAPLRPGATDERVQRLYSDEHILARTVLQDHREQIPYAYHFDASLLAKYLSQPGVLGVSVADAGKLGAILFQFAPQVPVEIVAV